MGAAPRRTPGPAPLVAIRFDATACHWAEADGHEARLVVGHAPPDPPRTARPGYLLLSLR